MFLPNLSDRRFYGNFAFTVIGKYKKHIDFFINWCYSIYVEIIPHERLYMERSYYIFFCSPMRR